MKRPPRNSYAAMGFEAKFNRSYAYYASETNMTPYELLIKCLNDPKMTDYATAKLFGCSAAVMPGWKRMIADDKTKHAK